MFYNSKYVLQHKMRTKRCMPLTDFTFPSWPFQLTQNTFKLLQEFTSVSFLKYSSHTCHVYHLKQSVVFIFTLDIYKNCVCSHYKSMYKSRSVVAAMNTRTYKSAIWKQFWGHIFDWRAMCTRSPVNIEVSALALFSFKHFLLYPPAMWVKTIHTLVRMSDDFLPIYRSDGHYLHSTDILKPLFQSSQKLVRSSLRVLASN